MTRLVVCERGERLEFAFEDLMRYHGPGSPGGVAHAFKVLERALPLLCPEAPCERREIVVDTAFGGPGARDAIELVTRAVTGDRFHLEPALARPERGRALERFVFRLSYRGRRITLAVRDGLVTDEFIDLARTDSRSPEQERRLDELKREMAELVMSLPPDEVYDPADEDTVRLFADAVNRFDPETAVALCDPEIEFLSVLAVTGAPYSGHEGVRQYFQDISSAWDRWRVEVHRVSRGLDGRVAIVMTMHWRGRESGTALADRTAHAWTLRNGRLLRNEPYREPEQALRAVGLAP